MPHTRRTRIPAALALLLSLAIAALARAQDAPANPNAAAAAGARKGPPAAAFDPTLAAKITRGVNGTILSISEHEIAVRDLTEGSSGTTYVPLAGGPDVPVTGTKKSWSELRKGDLVVLSFSGDPPRAVGIEVLPPSMHPAFVAATGGDPYKKHGRVFTGWIKQIDAKTMVVRTPDGPIGSKRKGEVKTFLREDDTVVDMLRGSWTELKKGDRVTVQFRKGEPRPTIRVTVILRGGEKPLPRGLATRLYDPAYDGVVKDVDGIGEWPPGEPWPPKDARAAASEPAPRGAPAPSPAK